MFQIIAGTLLKNKEIITLATEIFTAIGTVGAVIVALWLSYRDNKPKLRVHAIVGIIFPEKTEHLWLYCVNTSKLAISCTGLGFNPNRFSRNSLRLMPTSVINEFSNQLPHTLQYGDRMDRYFESIFFNDKVISNFLGKQKWIAKIKLKLLWRVVATTNIREFEGKLSSSLINKLLSKQFPTKSRTKNKVKKFYNL